MDCHNFYIYSNLDFSSKSAGSTRMRYYARALATDKQQVYLVSCCRCKLNEKNFVEIEPNIFILENDEMTKNLYGVISFLRRFYRFAKLKSSKRCFIYYPYPLLFLEVLSLFYLKLYKGQAVFYELNEIRKHSSSFNNPTSLARPIYSIKKLIFKLVFTVSQPLLYCYNGLICISTNIEKYGAKFNKKTIRIPILTDPYLELARSKNTYFVSESFNIGFSGTIDAFKENLVDFLGIVKKLNELEFNVSFNLCGRVSRNYHASFLNEVETRSEINYFGNLNKVEFSTFLSQQDLLVIPRGFSLQNKYGFSTKLSDYLNHKKVVLITDISDNKMYIKDGINGFMVPPDNNKAMFEKLVYIIERFDSFKTNIISKAYETASEDFYYKTYSEPLRTFLKS